MFTILFSVVAEGLSPGMGGPVFITLILWQLFVES